MISSTHTSRLVIPAELVAPCGVGGTHTHTDVARHHLCVLLYAAGDELMMAALCTVWSSGSDLERQRWGATAHSSLSGSVCKAKDFQPKQFRILHRAPWSALNWLLNTNIHTVSISLLRFPLCGLSFFLSLFCLLLMRSHQPVFQNKTLLFPHAFLCVFSPVGDL